MEPRDQPVGEPTRPGEPRQPGQPSAEEVARRRQRYLRLILPAVLLVAFGFFVPAPTPLRAAALVIAAVLVPIAVTVGNSRSRGGPR